MARSVAQQAEDNRRRRATGQRPVPISYDSGPPNPSERPTSGYGMPATQPPVGSGSAAPASGTGQAPTPWTPTDKPGYGETYWEKYGNQWQQPGASTNYWQGVQGHFAGPTTYENNVGGYASQLGNNRGALENLYDQYNGAGEFTNPGAGEQWWAQNGAQYNTPSSGEQSLGNVVKQLGATGDMENWYAQNGDQFNNTGDMERFYTANVGKLYGNNNLAQHAGGIASDINSARNTGSFFGATVSDLARPGYAESLADRYDPNQRTYNEDFLLGGGATEGLNSLYNRLFDQSSQRISKEGAARGGFNSGASLRAIEESDADLRAQHVRDYMSASNAADQSRFARDNYGLNLMTGADAGLRGRIGLGLEGANMVDTTALARAGASRDLYTGVSDELRNNLTTAGNWAQNSQADWLARLLGGANTANMSQTNFLDRMGKTTTAANNEATQFLNRLNSGSEGASRAQSDWKSRIDTGLGAANDAQSAWRSRLMDAAGLDKDAQAMMWDRLMNGGTLANMADNSEFQRLTGGFTAANAAEASKQNRQGNTFDNLYRSGAGQAGAYGNQQNIARDEQRQATMDEINGLIAQGGITSQEIMAKYGARMQALGLIIQGGKVVMGAATGNPGLMAGGMDTGGASPRPSYGTSYAPVTEDQLFPY